MTTMKAPARLLTIFCCILFTQEATAQMNIVKSSKSSYRSMYELLKDVPGIEVKMDGRNGAQGSVTVRGVNTLKSDGKPLFVVNNMIFDDDISNISPQDVEDVMVLKDAAATSWGTRAMFGVIMITLKKGITTSEPVVKTFEGSAYAYFIERKIPLKVFGHDDKVIIEGLIQRQKGDTLIFQKRRKDVLIPISTIKRVQALPQED